MKARKANLLAVILLFAARLAAADPSAKPVSQTSSPKKFACYYGYGRLDELEKYNLVVLQPSAYNPSDIAMLKEAGVTVLAYISLGEDEELRRGNGRGPGGWADWYLDEFKGGGFVSPGKDKQPDKNANWDSYYVDPSRSSWRKYVLETAKRLKSEFGFDGLLLDTVLLPRDVYREKTERRMDKGMGRLLSALRRDWPEGYLLGNNAWEFLGKGNTINGIMMENSLGEDPAHFEKVGRSIEEIRKTRRLDTFLVENISPNAIEKADRVCRAALSYGFISAIYSDDDAGRALMAFPWKTCVPSEAAPRP